LHQWLAARALEDAFARPGAWMVVISFMDYFSILRIIALDAAQYLLA
jgi:hypothetical protein